MQMCVFATIKGKGMTICDYNRQYRFKKSGKSYPTHFVQHRILKNYEWHACKLVIRCILLQNLALYNAL